MRWNKTIHSELAEVFTAVGMDTATKVLILTGTGQEFCGEIDAASFRGGADGWDVTWWEGRRMLTGLVEIDVPVITAVNGPVSIHSELAVMADVVLTCPEATFADHAHFTHGVVPGAGVDFVLTELLGPTRGRWFC